jgi:hypothetical protein
MYRISNNKRKYSTTPIVKVEIGADGKETETIVCVFTLTKKQGDALSEEIVNLLNKNLLAEAFEAGREYQEYKSNANLEEKSWEYTFAKWCEKNGIPIKREEGIKWGDKL